MSRFNFLLLLFHFLGLNMKKIFGLFGQMTRKGKDKKTMHKRLNSNFFAPYGRV
jgi:hypothetical protein